MKHSTWLSTHLFYYGNPWESFLAEGVKPFVDKLLGQNLAESYFFIRYNEFGPHIRLRLRCDDQQVVDELKSLIISHFEDYFAKYPSESIHSEQHKNHYNYPNNSIQFIDYKPEINRYGGINAMSLTEHQFFKSSEIILSIFKENNSWSYNKAIGVALELHLIFAFSFIHNHEKLYHFFDFGYYGWVVNIVSLQNSVQDQESIDRIENSIKQSFDNQKEILMPYLSGIWKKLIQKERFKKSYLNGWHMTMDETGSKFNTLLKNNQISCPIMDLGWLSGKLASYENHWQILESYCHMTNNRLGILNRDEAFIYYILREFVKIQNGLSV